ncbi:hypothetical protein [Nonomuraea sp. NPDC003804]|uniref:hypothetical protein n=1 Tax=Nonomuraea sp. NPDC003804 TaxID=3154547 RepID=UPI0033A92F30
MTAWARVHDRIIARDARGLAYLAVILPDAGRAEVARHLPDLRRDLREAAARRARERRSLGLGGAGKVWTPR